MSSTSFWVMDLGRPLIYRLASFIVSELGRAYETCREQNLIKTLINMYKAKKNTFIMYSSFIVGFFFVIYIHVKDTMNLFTLKV